MNRAGLILVVVGVVALVVVGAVLATRDPAPPPGDDRDASGREPPPESVEAIVDVARQGPEDPRFGAILNGEIPIDDDAMEALLELFEDAEAHPNERLQALHLLEMRDDPEIGPRILAIMKGPPPLDPDMMDVIVINLARRKETRFAQDLVEFAVADGVSTDRIAVFADAIRDLGVPVDTSPLHALFRSKQEPHEREFVAGAIVTSEGPGASPAVDAIIREDEEPGVWIRCVEGIKERRTPEDHRYLASLVTDESLPVERRAYVARAFDGKALPEAVPGLTRVLADGEAPEEVLLAVAESVGKQAPDGLAHRLRGTLEPDRPVSARVAVARALRLSGDREGLDDVRGALTGSTTPPAALRAELASALGELGGRADLVQLETLRDRDPDESVRAAAAEALTRLEEHLAEDPDR